MKTRQRFAAFGIAACVAATAGPVASGAAVPASDATASDATAAAPPAPKPQLDQSASALPTPPGGIRNAAARAGRVCVREQGRKICRRYGTFSRYFGARVQPKGVGATFSVHAPKQVGRRGMHSLAEISLHKPGALGDIIEVGWRRARGDRPRLFVFRWNKYKPSCYNRCGGFKVRGPGKRPGSALRVGSNIRVEWRHHHRRWNLYVNGKWSGFYPDRIFNGTFKRVRLVQMFGEVSFFKNGRGRCVDMGNGRFPGRNSARVYKIRYLGTTAGYRAGQMRATAPKLYKVRRTSPRSFKYGGPGPC